jgi:hypothetical protein
MVRIFDIQEGKVIPSEHCYINKSLKDVMDTYPENYLKIYAYAFYMTCQNPDLNPYFDVPEMDKEELILKEIEADFDTEDDIILNVLKYCKILYQTPTSRAYEAIKIGLDNMAHFMATTIPTAGRDGSATALLRIAKDFDAVRQSFKGVYRDLMEEQQTVRGGQSLAYDQRKT